MNKLISFLLALFLAVPALALPHPRHEDRVKTRDQLLDDYESRLNTWDKRIAGLKKSERAPKLRRAERRRRDYAVIDLEKDMEEARREFRAMKGASDRQWDEHKVALEERLDIVGKSYRSELAE